MAGHVFVSYSRTDTLYTQKLTSHLVSAGIPVWVDSNIDYGERWEREIREQIDSCAALLIVMSPEAEDSTWVANELARAQSRNKPIIPLLLRGEVFFRLGHLQHENVTGGAMPPPRLVERLRALAGSMRGAPQAPWGREQSPPPRMTTPLPADGEPSTTSISRRQETIEEMRQFEREYRIRLKAYGEGRQRDLKGFDYAAVMDAHRMRQESIEYHTRLAVFLQAQLDALGKFQPSVLPAHLGSTDPDHRRIAELDTFQREYLRRLAADLANRQRLAQHDADALSPSGVTRMMSGKELHALLGTQVQRDLDSLETRS